MKSFGYSENTEDAKQEVVNSGVSKPVTWMLLLGLAALIAVMRLHTYNEPTDRDQATYAVIAHEILSGGRLYDGLLLDQKPPAIHITYGLAELIVGYGRAQIYLLGVGAAVVTMLGFYFAGRTIGKKEGLWVAAIWTIVSGHLALEANQPNSEVFINAWTLCALAVLLRKPASSSSWFPALIAGCCFAAASLYKHVVVLIPFAVLLAMVCWPPEWKTRKRALLDMVIIGGVGVLAWGIVFAYFAATGRWESIINCLLTYNRYYSGDTQKNFFSALTHPESILSPALLGLMPLILLAILGLFVAFRCRQYFHFVFLMGLGIGTEIAVALPGKFYPHYYQLWYPFLILGTGVALHLLTSQMAKPAFRRMVRLALVLILFAIELPAYFKTPKEWSRLKYGEIFVLTDHLAKEIKAMLKPDETFWQLGSQTQLYMDTKQSPSGALVDYGTFSGPLATDLSRRTMESFQSHPPDLIVIENGAIPQIPEQHPILLWIYENYRLAPRRKTGDLFGLWVRKGSNLELRLEAQQHS